MSFTKGKWEIALPKHPDIRQIEDRLICVRTDNEKLHIAEVYQYQNHNNREANGTAIANAYLIASAPVLLNLCKKWANKMKLSEIYKPFVEETNKAIAQAEPTT